MTQTMDLNKMGLAPMNNNEMQEVEGGWAWSDVGILTFSVIACVATGGMAVAAGGIAVCLYGLQK